MRKGFLHFIRNDKKEFFYLAIIGTGYIGDFTGLEANVREAFGLDVSAKSHDFTPLSATE